MSFSCGRRLRVPPSSRELAAKRYGRASVLRSSVRLLILAILLTWPAPTLGQQAEALRRLRTNIHQDMTTCIAFFRIVNRCLAKNSQYAKTAATYAKARDDLLYKSILLGAQLGISEEEAKFRLGMATDEMMQLIKSNCVNLTSLLGKHLEKCTAVAADPFNPLKPKDLKD
jgi:hypothetical protein